MASLSTEPSTYAEKIVLKMCDLTLLSAMIGITLCGWSMMLPLDNIKTAARHFFTPAPKTAPAPSISQPAFPARVTVAPKQAPTRQP